MNYHFLPHLETPHLANVQIPQMTDAPLTPVCYTDKTGQLHLRVGHWTVVAYTSRETILQEIERR